MKYDLITEIKELTDYTYAELGHDDLVGKIAVLFNNRFTARMGDANYFKRRIRLSAPLWPLATEKQREETIIHEACHIVQKKIWPYSSHHGREWKSLMRRMGLRPDRCHTVDTLQLKQKRAKYQHVMQGNVKCACKEAPRIGPVQYKRLVRGAKYRCNRCRQTITLAKPKELVLT